MRKVCPTIAVLSMLTSMTTVASAATIRVETGTVSINGSEPLSGERTAEVGDVVTAGPTGRARVAYGNGCTIAIDPGTVLTIVPETSCRLGLADANPAPGAAGAAGADGLAALGATAAGVAVVAGAVGLGVLAISKSTHGGSGSGSGVSP